LARSLHPTKIIKSSKLSISLDPRTGNLLWKKLALCGIRIK
jgi:hypothetical protein